MSETITPGVKIPFSLWQAWKRACHRRGYSASKRLARLLEADLKKLLREFSQE